MASLVYSIIDWDAVSKPQTGQIEESKLTTQTKREDREWWTLTCFNAVRLLHIVHLGTFNGTQLVLTLNL